MNEPLLPRYEFPDRSPSLVAMLRRGISDLASTIPASILNDDAVQLPGPGAPLIVADPALARQVLNDRSEDFVRHWLMRRLMRRSWGKGLAAAEGEAWRQQRRAAVPAFRPAAVDAALDAFAQSAGRVARRYATGEIVELGLMFRHIVASIIFTVLVRESKGVDSSEIAEIMPHYMDGISRFSTHDILPLPETVQDMLGGFRSNAAVRRLQEISVGIASARGQAQPPDDLIALLHGVGPIEDNIRGLLPAALDTTVSGASWVAYILACHPEWQDRISAEARQCAGKFSLDRLPLTGRVMREALRLYPPAPMIVRSAARRIDLGGHRLRKGQPVAVSIYAMHRHTACWTDPDIFDPDRFGNGKTASDAYMPFGFGPRMCIAAQFAMAEISVIIARLLSEYRLEPADPAPEVDLQITTRSRTGWHVIIRSIGGPH